RSFALQSLGIGDPRSQDLDGDYAPQHEVPRQIHDRHPAASEFLEKYISFIQEWTVSVAGDCDLLPVHHLIEKDWIRCRPRRVGRVTLDFTPTEAREETSKQRTPQADPERGCRAGTLGHCVTKA